MKRKKKNLLKPIVIVLVLLAIIGSFIDTPEDSGTQNPDSGTSSVIEDVNGYETISEKENSGTVSVAPGEEETTPQAPDDNSTDATVPPKEENNDATVIPPAELPAGSTFEVHYLDVGQGDCSLVLCDGHAMLIDGGESSESSKVYAYLKQHGVSHLDYMVASHAHSDHIGGLSGALNYATVDTAFCPVTEYDSKTFDSMVKYLDKQGVSITVPSAGDEFMLGSAHVQILGPQKNYDDPNDTSIVLKVTYGETSFLFTGDAERTAEADILNAGYNLSNTVLKVGHHGSDTSTSYPFLREIMPEYAVIQVGKDNSYGHPTEDTLSRLRDADVKVYRNDLQGDIICSSDGKTVSFTTTKNESVQTNPTVVVTPAADEPDDVGEYIGNKNSKKFHLPTCKNLPAEKNRIYFDSRQAAVDAGQSPCGNCNP